MKYSVQPPEFLRTSMIRPSLYRNARQNLSNSPMPAGTHGIDVHVPDLSTRCLQHVVHVVRQPAEVPELRIVPDRHDVVRPRTLPRRRAVHGDRELLSGGHLQHAVVVRRRLHFHTVDRDEVVAFLHIDVGAGERRLEAQIVRRRPVDACRTGSSRPSCPG